MKLFVGVSLLAVALFSLASTLPEAPTGFDNKTNGLADDATHAADQVKFDEIILFSCSRDPLYLAHSRRRRSQNLSAAALSQCSELRLGLGGLLCEFADLAGAARGGVLMALAAGLRVVERAQAVGDL